MEKDFKPTLTFEISTSNDLFNKLLEEYSDFDKQHLNPRFAMNSAINSWHLTDWTYQEFFINDERFQNSESINKKGELKFISGLLKYQQYLTKLCPELEYMRLITNGTKHCILSDKSRREKTVTHIGDYSSDYSRHDYNVTRFIIQLDENTKIDFEKTLLSTIDFWKKYLEEQK
ncbi:hypothetical protein L1S34_14510 [Flavobacterium sp. K77]|uniref:hypothetical protein n=1 Tax=Flavobacterium sp. K77 TaxID=2910676 RepID=UPI001F34E5F7|nr:hypothetical protein [Flavobacterium sp. K77]MCF6142505.1 hypothetical protein [Flavobacterium sp. K77]